MVEPVRVACVLNWALRRDMEQVYLQCRVSAICLLVSRWVKRSITETQGKSTTLNWQSSKQHVVLCILPLAQPLHHITQISSSSPSLLSPPPSTFTPTSYLFLLLTPLPPFLLPPSFLWLPPPWGTFLVWRKMSFKTKPFRAPNISQISVPAGNQSCSGDFFSILNRWVAKENPYLILAVAESPVNSQHPAFFSYWLAVSKAGSLSLGTANPIKQDEGERIEGGFRMVKWNNITLL